MYAIYANIYHQYTPNVSINLPYIRILWAMKTVKIFPICTFRPFAAPGRHQERLEGRGGRGRRGHGEGGDGPGRRSCEILEGRWWEFPMGISLGEIPLDHMINGEWWEYDGNFPYGNPIFDPRIFMEKFLWFLWESHGEFHGLFRNKLSDYHGEYPGYHSHSHHPPSSDTRWCAPVRERFKPPIKNSMNIPFYPHQRSIELPWISHFIGIHTP